MAWTPIGTMRRGQRPDFTLLNEPGSAYVTRAQRWLTDQLIHLEPRTVIAGWYSHKPGYHDTVGHNDARDKALGTDDYSTRDPEDRRGPRDKTRAWDWTFRDAQAGNYVSFAKYGDRLMVAYRNGDPRLNGWREWLGRVSVAVTVNGKSTKRVGIDFRHRYLRIPDSTHDWHAHGSEDTEQVESFWNKWALLTVLAGWTLAEWQQSIGRGFMAGITDDDQRALIWRVHALVTGAPTVQGGPTRGEVVVTNQRQLALAAAISRVDDDVAAALQADFEQIDADAAALAQAVQAVPEQTVEGLLERPVADAAQALVTTLGAAHAAELAAAILNLVPAGPAR